MQIIANRIKQARLAKGLSQGELSKLCGWSTRVRISNYENGKRIPPAKEIIAISSALDVSIDWLYGRSIPPALTQKLKQFVANKEAFISQEGFERLLSQCKFVPIIDPKKMIMENNKNWPQREHCIADEYEVTLCPVSSRAFAITIQGDSMEGSHGISFSQGTNVIIDPERPYGAEDYVLAYLKDSNHMTFKKLISDSGRQYLKSLNSNYPMIEVADNIEILGTAIQSNLKL